MFLLKWRHSSCNPHFEWKKLSFDDLKARGLKADKKEPENPGPNLKFFETILLVEVVCLSKIKMIFRHNRLILLSDPFWVRQAQREVVKIKNLDFSYWASSTPWGHVLSL